VLTAVLPCLLGRFLKPYDADDVVFGNIFDKTLNLPWGSGAALKLMKYIDPTLEQDLGSATKPWALSPLISTMPYIEYKKYDPAASKQEVFPPRKPIAEDTATLKAGETADQRRAYFRDVEHRKQVPFGPDVRS
jgi:hypothetical protein